MRAIYRHAISSLLLLGLMTSGCAGAAENPRVPDTDVAWSLPAAGGDIVSFPYAHDGPVMLFFWATWCPFCKALMPHLQSILDEYPDGSLTIYAINFRDDGDPVAFMQSEGFGFTLLLGGGEVARQYNVHATPGLLLFDRNDHLVLNIYDVMERYNTEFELGEDLSNRQKAARKAPWWAARIREALDSALQSRALPRQSGT